MAELTPLPIYQNAPLDEISGYQVGTKIGIFDPDPLPDHQIGLLRCHLENFPLGEISAACYTYLLHVLLEKYPPFFLILLPVLASMGIRVTSSFNV